MIPSSTQIAVSFPMKSGGAAYLWWFFFGAFGAHKFYLGRPLWGVIYACSLGLLGFGLLWDLFTIPSQVRAANARLLSEMRRLCGPAGAETVGNHLYDNETSGLLSNVDDVIARFKQKRAQAEPSAAAPSKGTAMVFGKRK
jgi:TM2 domain-containing membrane protein YozV